MPYKYIGKDAPDVECNYDESCAFHKGRCKCHEAEFLRNLTLEIAEVLERKGKANPSPILSAKWIAFSKLIRKSAGGK